MPRIKKSSKELVKSYAREFPNDLTDAGEDGLFCKICITVVNHSKRYFVLQHLKTESNNKKRNINKNFEVEIFKERKLSKIEKITETFLKANIPLYKLRNIHIRNLFNYLGHPLPSETASRNAIKNI